MLEQTRERTTNLWRGSVLLALVAIALSSIVHADQTQTLTAGDIATVRSAPVRASQWSIKTTSVGTSTSALVDAITADDAILNQELRISNRHASNDLCYTVIDRSTAGATGCATDCAALSAGALTCTGGSADGDIIKAGSSIGLTISGADCLCGEASGASTTTTVARVMRYPL